MDARLVILLGLVLVLVGLALPLLMVMGMLGSTYLLCFVAFSSSLGGLVFGMIGGAQLRRERGGAP